MPEILIIGASGLAGTAALKHFAQARLENDGGIARSLK